MLEHAAQRGDIAVVGHGQDQIVLLARGGCERAFSRTQGIGGGELQPDMAARDEALELARRALGDDPATVKDRDPVGELVGLLQILGSEEDRDALGRQSADRIPHGAPAARIQTGRGVVEEDHPRGADERHGQIQPPSHPAGVGRHRLAGGVGQVEHVEQLAHPASPRLATQMVQIQSAQMATTGQCPAPRGPFGTERPCGSARGARSEVRGRRWSLPSELRLSMMRPCPIPLRS